jgi:hypothetical protein
MKTSQINLCLHRGLGSRPCNALLPPLFLLALLASSTSHAQIYKWVDENGRTHYSEKSPAGKGASEELRVRSSSTSALPSVSSSDSWQDKERQFQERQAKKSVDEANRPTGANNGPKSLSKGRMDESPQGKCNFAKDIVNGTVRRRSGAPIDQYDIEVAKNDIKAYCR